MIWLLCHRQTSPEAANVFPFEQLHDSVCPMLALVESPSSVSCRGSFDVLSKFGPEQHPGARARLAIPDRATNCSLLMSLV